MHHLAMNTPEMSDCDLLHTLRWSSRLQIPSYVVWIKVQPQLRGVCGGGDGDSESVGVLRADCTWGLFCGNLGLSFLNWLIPEHCSSVMGLGFGVCRITLSSRA